MPTEIITNRPQMEQSPRRATAPEAEAKSPPPQATLDTVLDRLVRIFTSLKLTVVCLGLGIVLVFWGTLAQVEVGLLQAQNEFFRSFVVYWGPKGASWKIPVFPGGYVVGGVLLLNLISAHVQRFTFTRKKAGIWVVHAGLILLLVGQLMTDMLSHESALQLFEGESRNYSEDFRGTELALIDTSDPKSDLVFAIADKMLKRQNEVRDSRLPFTVRVKNFWPNADLVKPGTDAPAGALTTGATAGDLKDALVLPQPLSTDSDSRNMPAAVVELLDGAKSAGTFVVWSARASNQPFNYGGKTYEVCLRFARSYYPFSLTLLKATHEQYKGTKVPKNFASRVRVENPQRNEARETEIHMNSPLRYGGLTFYQYQMAAGEAAEQAGRTPSSTFQVVRNPGWLTPYLSCIMIATGLLIQFGTHLVGFLKKTYAT